MTAPSDYEQFLLEQVNFARLDPQGDFARYISDYETLSSDNPDIQMALDFFSVVGATLKAQVDALETAPPLAMNALLTQAADGHNNTMIRLDAQFHVNGTDEPGARITDAGYTWSRWGENVYAYGKDAVFSHAGFMVDWGDARIGAVDGIQNPPGHRIAIMDGNFREVGIAVTEETNEATTVGPFVVGQKFATRFDLDDKAIVLGHVRSETDGDGFYSMGEGTEGVTVGIEGGSNMVTPGAGGYQIETGTGATTVTFSGGSLSQDISVTATLEATNVKIDLVDGHKIETSVSLELGAGARHASFIADQGTHLTGNDVGNRLEGNDLRNVLEGGSGPDKLFGHGFRDILRGEDGRDKLVGGAGRDKLFGGNGGDQLKGGGGQDMLNGGKGADVLVGGGGADRFVFKGGFGKDVIKDFRPGDTAEVAGLSADNFETAIQDTDAGALLTLGKRSILFEGVTDAELTPDLFGL